MACSPADAAASFALDRYQLHVRRNGETFACAWLERMAASKIFSFLTGPERDEAIARVRSELARA
jgi:hypothetical protein